VIKKVIRLKNIGLFYHGCPDGAVVFDQITAIYADNARGKSTFVTALRACHMSDATRLVARQTIDVPEEPEVELLLENGMLKYENGAWSGPSPDIAVFDSEFVEQNVYSGFTVRTDQRQALLDFALGETIVPLKNRVDELSRDIQEQTTKIGEAEKQLIGLAAPLDLKQFINMRPIADAEVQINKCRKRIDAAKSSEQLNIRRSPTAIELVDFDLHAVFDVLSRQLTDIEKTVEATVGDHFAKHGGVGLEDWISQGQVFMETPECPFCGQSLNGLELIAAYRSYFNTAYQDLKEEVAALEIEIASSLADALVDSIVATTTTNAAIIEAWNDRLDVDPPGFDGDAVRDELASARNALIDLAKRKLAALLEPVGTPSDFEAAKQHIAAINRVLEDYNNAIDDISSKIADFKRGVVTENIEHLETEISKHQASLRRQEPEVVQICEDYQSAITEKDRLEQEKRETRSQIDLQMGETLTQYQASINRILATFGATFLINQLSTDYRGGSGKPRTQYGLQVREREVVLGNGSDFSSGHNFSTTLSESDKRTLALAFFIARLEDDPALESKIVVLDDPMSSMDRNRRSQTIRRVASLAINCKQLIVLSHDAYFLRQLRDQLQDPRRPITLKVLRITRVDRNYSAFCDCNLDEICESDYYRHHRMVAEYVKGTSSTDIRDVAKAIRPLLEGYLHRRFPGKIPRNQMLGKIIADQIAPATSGPLSHLQQHEEELREINGYASQFHHDTNRDADSVNVVDAELLHYARQALDMIYKNG